MSWVIWCGLMIMDCIDLLCVVEIIDGSYSWVWYTDNRMDVGNEI